MRLPVDRTQPFNASTFIRNEWATWRGPVTGDGYNGAPEEDGRSLDLHEIDWSLVQFVDGLREGETSILGEEHLVRLRAGGGIVLDARVGQAMYEDYLEKGRASVLEWLRLERGIVSFSVKGTTLRCPAGGRYAMYFSYDGRIWDWGGCWQGCRQGADAAAPVVF